MAKISDLKFTYQLFMKAYLYRRVDWHPGARLKRPLREARIAVVTTAAFSGITSDKNFALPIDRLKALVDEGVIGSVAPRHFSFMGSDQRNLPAY
jgi:hypothetical protein